MPTTVTINGDTVTFDAPEDMPLLWVLRDTLGKTGTKFGCGQGLCGACTVQVDGMATRACLTPVGDIDGAEVRTIEHTGDDVVEALRQAWLEHSVAQCGYCQAGQIMTAAALLAENRSPDDQAIDDAMSGNLCRCGTYGRIRAAVHRAASLLAGTA
jgi:isoquinoline 1-oxidoreductase alpha subunit